MELYTFCSSKHPFSQWYDSPFVDEKVKFRTAKHYIMYKKALLFIDQTAENGTDGLYFIASTQNNNYYLYPLGENGARDFVPLILNDNGSFINPADYDDENNILYSYNGTNSISRAKLLPDGENQGSRRGFNGTTDNLENMAIATAHAIEVAAGYLHEDFMQEHLNQQQNFYKKFYNWNKKGQQWTNFLKGVLNERK